VPPSSCCVRSKGDLQLLATGLICTGSLVLPLCDVTGSFLCRYQLEPVPAGDMEPVVWHPAAMWNRF
jgi:hypothetical protein